LQVGRCQMTIIYKTLYKILNLVKFCRPIIWWIYRGCTVSLKIHRALSFYFRSVRKFALLVYFQVTGWQLGKYSPYCLIWVLGMMLSCIHIFIITGSFLYWFVIRSASQRFFIHSCIYLRILIISYLATFLGINSLSVLMCRLSYYVFKSDQQCDLYARFWKRTREQSRHITAPRGGAIFKPISTLFDVFEDLTDETIASKCWMGCPCRHVENVFSPMESLWHTKYCQVASALACDLFNISVVYSAFRTYIVF